MGILPLNYNSPAILLGSLSSLRPEEPVTIFLNENELGKTVTLNNSMIAQGEIRYKAAEDVKGLTIRLTREQGSLIQFDILKDRQNEGKLNLSEIMKWIPPGTGATITITGIKGKKPFVRKIEIKRSTADIVKDPGKAKKSIAPLYDRIAVDLAAGKPLIITSNVVLWDASFGNNNFRASWADGKNPETNLYWGGGLGIYSAFKKVFGWEIAYEEKGKIAVFKKTVQPNGFWKKRGIKKPFEMYAVFNVYRSDDILAGYREFAQNLFGARNQPITLKNGKTIEAGGQSRIVGYVGHMIKDGAGEIQKVRRQMGLSKSGTKGVYLTTCLSAPEFAPHVLGENIYGLLFSTRLMPPEGYNQDALFKAVARGENGTEIPVSVSRAFERFQGNYPKGLFLSSESPKIERYSLPYDGDADKDGVPNRFDPEPDIRNKYEFKDKILTVITSTGKRVKINLRDVTLFDRNPALLPQ